jgi:hypothetical protein
MIFGSSNAQALPVPYCGQLIADMGAEIIKVDCRPVACEEPIRCARAILTADALGVCPRFEHDQIDTTHSGIHAAK